MGRPEKPIEAAEPALGKLASWLREQRQRSGLTYRQLAESTNFHPTTLQRAAAGRTLPGWKTVEAMAGACGGDLKAARRKWATAAYWNRVPHAGGTRRRRALRWRERHPDDADSSTDLRQAMVEMRRRAHWPSLEELDRRARLLGRRLPSSTLALVLRGEAPLRRELFLTYMEVLGVKEARARLWAQAWERTHSARTPAQAAGPLAREREFTLAMRSSSAGASTEILFRLWAGLRAGLAADRDREEADGVPYGLHAAHGPYHSYGPPGHHPAPPAPTAATGTTATAAAAAAEGPGRARPLP
ncbi:helix-turn-helix domain-containing protein [Kitasatospora sp. NPDC051170]|uniref:helix-turn-helix domain-containing protein n=1 Tax=Kitasatospora sp. NPDC051170 TaxID=3364056 RepID=UPI0037BBB148